MIKRLSKTVTLKCTGHLEFGPYMRRGFIIVAFALLLVLCSSIAGKEWHTFTPPDRSFSVDVPGVIREVGSYDGEHGVWNETDPDNTFSKSYALAVEPTDESRYGVLIIEGKKADDSTQRKSTWELAEYLSKLYIGDDDETQFMRGTVRVTVNGVKGWDYTYIKADRLSSQSQYTRGRIFMVGNSFYLLIYRGRDEADLRSAHARRFLNSFRWRGSARHGRVR